MSSDTKAQANIFYADNRFERMARRSGGVERDEALDKAHAHLEEMKAEFVDWVDQELQGLSAALSQVESNPGDFDALDRAFHSCAHLRDVGGTMSFELVTFVADNLCDILDAMKSGAPHDKDAIDCHMKALRLAKTEPYRHLRPDQVPELISGLRRVGEIASIVPGDNGQ